MIAVLAPSIAVLLGAISSLILLVQRNSARADAKAQKIRADSEAAMAVAEAHRAEAAQATIADQWRRYEGMVHALKAQIADLEKEWDHLPDDVLRGALRKMLAPSTPIASDDAKTVKLPLVPPAR